MNIAEILKDCPKGTVLYSPLCGECELIVVDYAHTITIKDNDNMLTNLFPNGTYRRNGECVLFPSKENRDWSKFQRPFEDGDIIKTITHNNYVFYSIYKGIENKNVLTYIDYTPFDNNEICGVNGVLCLSDEIIKQEFATEEEKQKLFNAIKANGYKWNAETKTLEKLVVLMFKVGDRIKKKGDYISGIITNIDEDNFYKVEYGSGSVSVANYNPNNWELVPNKFDITTLKPFDKVLVRHNKDNKWDCSFFSYVDEDLHSHCYKFVTTTGKSYPYCIPYENNEHLLGTTNDCDEYYKTW